MNIKPSFYLNKVSVAVASALSAAALFTALPAYSVEQNAEPANAQVDPNDPNDFEIEVIAITARQKSAASEVMEERRYTPYVADLMGADQISRTGDSDAASALRRVTGLTLKGGKFIYVRGLGERYSSTSLNGAIVPSPDPTRNVVPLDMFPASIIQSLSVQKSGSANAPAAFGGGHVDIRTKAIPSDFVFKIGLGGRMNSNDSDDALSYNGGDSASGKDDGTREFPLEIQNAYDLYGGIDPINDIRQEIPNLDLAREENRRLATTMHRDMTVEAQDTDKAFRGKIAVGNKWDLFGDAAFGFIASGYYKKQQENYQEVDVELADENGLVNNSKEVQGTDSVVQWSTLLNMGFELNEDHKIETFTTYLRDTSDDVSVAIEETIDTVGEDNALQVYNIDYEERTLIANQIKGTHYFTDYADIELTWFYSDARSERYAPSEVSYTYGVVIDDETGEITERRLNTQDEPKFVYTRLDDATENTGFELTLPVEFSNGAVLRLSGGYNYFERVRQNYATRLGFDADDFDSELLTLEFSEIFTDENIMNEAFEFELKDASTTTEDYLAAEMIDAAFGNVDLNMEDVFRIQLGVRYEDFRRVTLPLTPEGKPSDESGRYDLIDYAKAEDGFYPSLAATWHMYDEMQWRLGLSKTVVRPDLRETSPVRFQDPVTGIDSFGNPELESSDILNFDLRYEWYQEDGSNLSVGVFYKDLEAPIEPVQRISEAGRQQKFYNAESGFVRGVELEFMQDLSFGSKLLEGFFMSGNYTKSTSEIEITPNGEINPTHTTRPMTGHSEHVVNLQLSFDSPDAMHSMTLAYNYFSERIAWGGNAGLEDIYEQPFNSLDFSYSLFPSDGWDVKFKAKNILEEETEYMQDVHQVFWKNTGTEYTLEVSYSY